jgi:GntR family transcriptional repressor for pyruvate dehydrogenase complex
LEAFKDHIAVGMRFHGASVKAPQDGLEDVLAEHRAIFDAIRDQDGGTAKHLMRSHLIGSRERVFDGI